MQNSIIHKDHNGYAPCSCFKDVNGREMAYPVTTKAYYMHKSQSPCTVQYKRPYRNKHALLIWRYFQGCVNNIGDKIPRYIYRDHNIDITLPVRYSLDSIKTGIALIKVTIFSLRHKALLIPCYSCVYIHAGFTLGALVLHIIGFLLGVAAIAIGKKFST